MSSSSSAAVLTESFDYDLHLENDKPAGFLSRLRFSHIYGIVIFVIVTLYLSYYRHASTCQSAEPPIDDVISAEKEQENLFKIRLKVTEDHNDQISSRINLLNDTLTSLRSRVYEIERKPVITSSLNFTATKILIDNNIRNLSERLSKQSKALEKLEDIQKITKSDINILKSEIDERDTKYSSYAADITQRLASIHSRLDTVQTKRDQHLFNLSVTSESQLKSRNMILLGKITKIEEKFSSAIETVEAFTNKVLETQNERDADKVNVEYISSHVETVVKKIWNENMEIYKQLIPAPVCPEMIVPPPKIIEVIKYAEAIIPVPPPPLSVDFARDYAGAEVMHEQTSITYSPPEINSNHITTNVLNYLGIDRNSDMGDSFIKSYLVRVVDILAPTSIRLLGTDKYVGRPEDAISSDMSLGSCWPLKGTSGVMTIKLPRMINIESISIDHISRDDAIDLKSAPKDFEVFGSPDLLEETSEENFLQRGSYNITSNYVSSQNFKIRKPSQPCQYVALRILTNHGNPEYTCLYRVRVHGEPI